MRDPKHERLVALLIDGVVDDRQDEEGTVVGLVDVLQTVRQVHALLQIGAAVVRCVRACVGPSHWQGRRRRWLVRAQSDFMNAERL